MDNSTRQSLVAACAAAVMLVAFCAQAVEYSLKIAPQSLADWQNGSFYVGGVAPTAENAPEAVVTIPANMTAKIDDDSIAFVGSFSWFKPTADTSLLEVGIDSDAVFAAKFAATASDDSHVGKLVKKGAGMLAFTSAGRYDHHANIDIVAGMLALPEQNAAATITIGDVDVAYGATLRLGASVNGGKVGTYMNTLTGGGDVTNGVGAASQCMLYIGYGNKTPAVFSGRILDKIGWQSHGYQFLTGTDSTFSGGFGIQSNSGLADQGINGVKKIGMAGFPSSVGKQTTVTFSDWGGRLVYLGDGETTDRTFSLNDSVVDKNNAAVFDAGAVGGLNLTGSFSIRNVGGTQRLHLAGSNTQECVFSGSFNSNGTTVAYVTKKGSGTWRFGGDASSRSGIGGVAVEDGTLAFDSIGEVGRSSTLGPGMVFTEDIMSGSASTRTNVPYFFRMGTATTAGTLSFSGTEPSATLSRPMVLSGDAVLLNNATNAAGTGVAFIYDSGISSLTRGEKKLTLSGTNTEASVVASISNGKGIVSIEKTGSGTWALAGTNNTFTGGVDVKEGKLILRGLGDFKWYRWTIRENQDPTSGLTVSRVSELGFFDADNLRVGLGLTIPGESLSSASTNLDPENYLKNIAPGNVALGRKQDYINNSSPKPGVLSALFDGVVDTYVDIDCRINGWSTYMRPTESDPSTWFVVVMRLLDSANEPKSYDWSCCGANQSSHPKSWLMEGSHDGYVWYVIDDVKDGPKTTYTSKRFQWAFNRAYSGSEGVDMGTPESPHLNGRRFEILEDAPPTVYTQAVSVASGATLEGVGDVVLTTLKVDPSSGGTIRGVSFASDGTLELARNFEGVDLQLPLTFDSVTDMSNIENWQLKVDGKQKNEYKVSVRNNSVFIRKPGFMVIVF